MPKSTTLVIASGNAGKVREFSQLLADHDFQIQPQPEGLEVEETGSSFAENACIKAIAVAQATGHWALADDSGLCVEALGGAPGVHSARYATNDAERIARLLQELSSANLISGEINRRAKFVAALAVADPHGCVHLQVQGKCAGEILTSPKGDGGFGYDPVFYVPEVGQTFAEMDKSLKGQIGHRGRAFALLKPELQALFGEASTQLPCNP